MASLLTGTYPTTHRATARPDRIDPGVRLLGDHLRRLGYHTAAFSTNPNVLPVWGFDQGFDDFYDIEAVGRSAGAARVNEVVFRHMAEKLVEPFFLYIHTGSTFGLVEKAAVW